MFRHLSLRKIRIKVTKKVGSHHDKTDLKTSHENSVVHQVNKFFANEESILTFRRQNWFSLRITSKPEKSYIEAIFFSSLWRPQWPLRSLSSWNLKSICKELSKIIWHLQFGGKMRSLEPQEVFTQIYQNSVKKINPPEWLLLEVRRFF